MLLAAYRGGKTAISSQYDHFKRLVWFSTEGEQSMRGTHSKDLFPCMCHIYVVLCDDDSDESQLLVCTFCFALSLCLNSLYLPLTSVLQTYSHTDRQAHCPACFSLD